MNLGWESTLLTCDVVTALSAPDKLVPAGHRINDPVPLFTRISDEEIQKFREK